MFTSGLHIDQAPPLGIPMRFFATGPIFLLIAGWAMIAWRDDLLLVPLTPTLVAVTHLVVLGWLTMVMFGALYQMIPVLAATRVPWLGLAPWVHASLVVGVLSLLATIGWGWHPRWLLVASAGLGVAITLLVTQIGAALIKTTVAHPTVTAMRLAVVALLLTLAMGGIFLGEYAHGFLALDRQVMVGIHLTFGLFGWVGVLVLGVSFQVLPLFYVMPPFPAVPAHRILTGIALSLVLIPATLLSMQAVTPWVMLAGVPGLIGILNYAWVMHDLVRQRKRKWPDPTYRFWQLGWLCGTIALLLLMCWPWVEDERLRHGFAIWYLLGWVSSIMIGMWYKIIPFLVWFHRFSRLAGLVTIPMMDDLLPEKVAKWHWLLHGATVFCLTMGVVGRDHWWIAMGGGGLMVTAAILGYAMWYALRIPPPEAPEMPDFSSYFQGMTTETPLPPGSDSNP